MAVDLAFVRPVEDFDSVIRLLNYLGYRGPARPVDASTWALEEYPCNRVMRLGRRKREGYALFLAEMDAAPTRLRHLGQQLLTSLWPFWAYVAPSTVGNALFLFDHDGYDRPKE